MHLNNQATQATSSVEAMHERWTLWQPAWQALQARVMCQARRVASLAEPYATAEEVAALQAGSTLPAGRAAHAFQ